MTLFQSFIRLFDLFGARRLRRMPLHRLCYACFSAQLCGYVALSTLLQFTCYHARASQPAQWKTQPRVVPHAPDGGGTQAREHSTVCSGNAY